MGTGGFSITIHNTVEEICRIVQGDSLINKNNVRLLVTLEGFTHEELRDRTGIYWIKKV